MNGDGQSAAVPGEREAVGLAGVAAANVVIGIDDFGGSLAEGAGVLDNDQDAVG